MIGGNNSKVPLQNCGMSDGIKCCVDNSLKSVQTAYKPIYYGNINHPFNNAINIAKNLQPKNDNFNWSKWELNNIGGKRLINKVSKKAKRMFGGNNSEVPLQNCAMSDGIKCCVENSLKSVQTANKPIYYGNLDHPFSNAINIAKNLQPNNDNSSWLNWRNNNIGGKKKLTKKLKFNIKKSKSNKY